MRADIRDPAGPVDAGGVDCRAADSRAAGVVVRHGDRHRGRALRRFALICVGLFGKAVMLAWLGGRIAGRPRCGRNRPSRRRRTDRRRAGAHPVRRTGAGISGLQAAGLPRTGRRGLHRDSGTRRRIGPPKCAPASALTTDCCAAEQRSTGVHSCCRHRATATRRRRRSRSRMPAPAAAAPEAPPPRRLPPPQRLHPSAPHCRAPASGCAWQRC